MIHKSDSPEDFDPGTWIGVSGGGDDLCADVDCSANVTECTTSACVDGSCIDRHAIIIYIFNNIFVKNFF